MENKNILVTGANGGLGQALVKEILTQKPNKIYCGARDAKTLKDIKSLSDTIEVIELDITNKDSISKAVSKIDKLDILVNNAGVNSNSRLFDNSFLDIEVNLKGTIGLSEAFFEKLKDSKGKVINISSVLALVNLPIMGNYSISKSALHSFSQALRAEFDLFGGEVYEVLPGPIETRMTEGFPMDKANPEDIARSVIEAVSKKEFEVFPDEFSKMIKQRVENDKVKLIEEFAMSLQG